MGFVVCEVLAVPRDQLNEHCSIGRVHAGGYESNSRSGRGELHTHTQTYTLQMLKGKMEKKIIHVY